MSKIELDQKALEKAWKASAASYNANENALDQLKAGIAAYLAAPCRTEGQMTRQEQIVVLHLADGTKLRQEHYEGVIDRLNERGFHITRTGLNKATS